MPFAAPCRPGSRSDDATRWQEKGKDLKHNSILVVEDNPDDELIMMRALRKSGVGNKVVVARDGVEALALLLGPGSLPGLVLLDVRLPKLDGLEVLKRLREDDKTRCLPVVLLTSCDGEREVLTRAGVPAADHYLPKSMNIQRFVRDVRSVIELLLIDAAQAPLLERGATTRCRDTRTPIHRLVLDSSPSEFEVALHMG